MLEPGADDPIGFCGFRVYEEHGPAPELLYAFLERCTGRGYATEAGAACVALARSLGRARIVAAVDEPNRASQRVFDKLGFRKTGQGRGPFGALLFYEVR